MANGYFEDHIKNPPAGLTDGAREVWFIIFQEQIQLFMRSRRPLGPDATYMSRLMDEVQGAIASANAVVRHLYEPPPAEDSSGVNPASPTENR